MMDNNYTIHTNLSNGTLDSEYAIKLLLASYADKDIEVDLYIDDMLIYSTVIHHTLYGKELNDFIKQHINTSLKPILKKMNSPIGQVLTNLEVELYKGIKSARKAKGRITKDFHVTDAHYVINIIEESSQVPKKYRILSIPDSVTTTFIPHQV